AIQATLTYDPWGSVQAIQGTLTSHFGFTGELQRGPWLYLRARWYNTWTGTFTSKDRFAGFPEQPYGLHPYQYAYSDPILNTDPSNNLLWDVVKVGTLPTFAFTDALNPTLAAAAVGPSGCWARQTRS